MNPRKDYQKALEMRLQGQTYGEIRSVFLIPKSTLSTWFSKLKMSDKTRKTLEAKRGNGYLKLIEFNKTRTRAIHTENEDIRKNYKAKINKLSRRELMILGAALYWGEGYKNFTLRSGHYPYICFGNSDPEMIQIFIRFMGKILNIPKDRMRCQAMIYPNIVATEAINYWQHITQIPKEYFRCQVAVSRASQGKRPKHLLPFGTLQIRVTRRQEFFKIKGLIDGIIRALK